MNAKYPITDKLTIYISNLREEKLKYSYEEFSELFGNSKTWAYNITKRKMQDIAIDDLWSIFLADYNYRLFIRKQARMKELLQDGINSKYVKETTLVKMFPKKVPIEIFKQGCCNVPSDFIKAGHTTECNFLFAEDRFPEEDRYICIRFDEMYKLSKKQTELIENAIIEIIEEIKETYTGKALRNEYWLFAFELMFRNVNINETLWERIKYICFDDEYIRNNDKIYKWRYIYSLLGKNSSLQNPGNYATSNVVYFDNPKEPISDENLPSFNIRYDFNEMISDDNDNYFERKLDDCVKGKIKLIDLFMIFYRSNFMDSKSKDNKYVFRKTYTDLIEYGVETPFSKLDLSLATKIEEKPIDLELIYYITKFFEQYEDPDKYNPITKTYDLKDRYKNNKGLVQFRKNMLTKTAGRFLDVIAIDFSFINKLPSAKDKVLRKELEDVVKEFKKKNLR